MTASEIFQRISTPYERGGTREVPCSCPFPPAWPAARSHQLFASASFVSAQRRSSFEPTLRETLEVHPALRQSKEVAQRNWRYSRPLRSAIHQPLLRPGPRHLRRPRIRSRHLRPRWARYRLVKKKHECLKLSETHLTRHNIRGHNVTENVLVHRDEALWFIWSSDEQRREKNGESVHSFSR